MPVPPRPRAHEGHHTQIAAENSAQADADRALCDLESSVKAFEKLSDEASVDDVRSLRARFILKKQTARAFVGILPAPEYVREARASALIGRFRAAAHARQGKGGRGLGERDLSDRTLPRSTQMLDHAAAVSGRNLASLNEGLAHVNASLNLARETASELAADRDKMVKIGSDLDEACSDLSLSVQAIKRYGKSLSTDRIFLVLLCLFIATAVGLGVYIALDPAGAARAFKQVPLLGGGQSPPSTTTGGGGGSIVDPMDATRQYRAPPVRGEPP